MASVALALAVAVGGSGCTLVTYQATTEKYDASDGVRASVGDLEVRNLLIVKDDDGQDANVVFTVSNHGDTDADLEVGLVAGESESVEVPAGGQVVLGVEEEPLLLTGVRAAPGGLAELFLATDGAEGVEVQVPVLDGRLPEYRHLLP
ncbi:DNA modification methylase [Agromyces intestinalis]|uniref:DNA modification methylase n=1 Tax=Agromyces intestinalis TaxID=2592652 RepID=A0A5C1YH73_9MICO|nr:DNA modification methylase [Agromyces intestinalis]QEO15303.1 DNA modification methylase [Agromyces intestinalis]